MHSMGSAEYLSKPASRVIVSGSAMQGIRITHDTQFSAEGKQATTHGSFSLILRPPRWQ